MELDQELTDVAALADPVRRDLYRYVAAQPEPVSRDQASEGVQVPRHTAKFHLDKLVEAGWLVVEYRRLSGRRGPGAGRPSKLYARSGRQVSVTLPERHYELVAGLMAQAVEDAAAQGQPVDVALAHAAAREGAALAGRVQAGLDPTAAAVDALVRSGYEPRAEEPDRTTLVNCPFDAVAREHRTLVCGLNLALLTAFTEALPDAGLAAALEPSPGRCCVVLART